MVSFDVNILEDALTQPNVPLTFPLPTDGKPIIDLEANEEMANNFSLIGNFVKFFSKTKWDDIYGNHEYRYSVNKHSKKFNDAFTGYMDDKLKRSDDKLDEIVYKLIDQELRMKLILAPDFPKRFKEVKEFMVRYYQAENKKNMPSYPHNLNFLRVAYITVMATLSKMFPAGIWVSRDQLSDLYREYLDNPMSIIYLPNHQSHIDYIILHLVAIRFQMSIPVVIAGENLNVAVFGKFLKNLGAIFIKRSFNNELYTERNLANLIEFSLLNKVHLEVFIEGTRSRDGKLLLPKYGVLKTLTQIYLNQHRAKNNSFDLLFQPTSITYERIYEADGYFDELIGKDKKQESSMMIVKNGLGNLIHGVDKDDAAQAAQLKKTGTYDNTNKTLHGKIFVVFGERFRLGKFVEENKSIDDDEPEEEDGVNLKKLGFKILHEVNRHAIIPEVGLVGCSIQIYHYYYNKTTFTVGDVIPVFRLLINQLKREDTSEFNIDLFNKLAGYDDAAVAKVFETSLIKFFRYIHIHKGTITIKNPIELLYYKNLTIHLIIHKCLLCFILLNTNSYNQIHRLFYIFTGFLKHEFLFDYNYNPRSELSFLLNELQADGIIDANYNIVDRSFVEIFGSVVKPFVEASMICIKFLIIHISKFYANITSKINEQQLINDDLMSKDYPTTKTLLRIITAQRAKLDHIELTNKQYLLSCLFYLNNLKLIKIFKNKSKTKAFVIIKNARDLRIMLNFLQQMLEGKTRPLPSKNDEIMVNYMIDIVDKNDERVWDSPINCKL